MPARSCKNPQNERATRAERGALVAARSATVSVEPRKERKSLRTLEGVRPLYLLPGDPFAEEVLIPGFEAAAKVDCMVGFFSSEVLASLAPGLSTYIAGSQNSFRLVISPLLRPEDQAAIEEGVKTSEDVAREILGELTITQDLLEQHTLKCLSWLLRTKRIEIQIALMKGALFHPKVWLFSDSGFVMAAHGSSNVTYAGIRRNIEQVAVSRSWEDPNQRYIAEKLTDQFARLWQKQDENCIVISLPDAVRDRLLQTYNSKAPPTEDELATLYRRAEGVQEHDAPRLGELPIMTAGDFAIPRGLSFESGDFEHQGRAVRAWCDAGFRGVLEMATGSGKTIAAMICAHRLYDGRKPLLIVVAAPYVPLIQQWCDEITPFGLRPVNLTLAGGMRGRAQELNRIKRRMRSGATDVEAVVVSHHTLSDESFKAELAKFECTRLLIADEVHNLGSEGFITDPPSFFEYRLGLSATPIRQYDDDGTQAIFRFFRSSGLPVYARRGDRPLPCPVRLLRPSGRIDRVGDGRMV